MFSLTNARVTRLLIIYFHIPLQPLCTVHVVISSCWTARTLWLLHCALSYNTDLAINSFLSTEVKTGYKENRSSKCHYTDNIIKDTGLLSFFFCPLFFKRTWKYKGVVLKSHFWPIWHLLIKGQKPLGQENYSLILHIFKRKTITKSYFLSIQLVKK